MLILFCTIFFVFKFTTWSRGGFKIRLTSVSDSAILTNYVDNGEWHLVEAPIENKIVVGCYLRVH